MMPALDLGKSLLRALYGKVPVEYQPRVKQSAWAALRRCQAALRLRRLIRAKRVEFLDFEIAHLEAYEVIPPGKHEVLVEVYCSAVSPGTERASLCGLPGTHRRFPYLPGYSCAGRIVEAGRRVRGFELGDRVAGQIRHVSHETVRLDRIFRIPDGVSYLEASFIEIGIITLQGMRKAVVQPGEKVAVVGQGLIGQFANRVARMLGAAKVIALARTANRRAIALSAGGAHEFVAAGEAQDAFRMIQADVVIEAVGTPQGFEDSMRCARHGGRVVLLGSSRGLGRDVDLHGLAQTHSIDIIGAHVSAVPEDESSPGRWTYRREGELFLSLLQQHLLDIRGLVTWRARPEECNAVYETLARGGESHVGIVFRWKDEEV